MNNIQWIFSGIGIFAVSIGYKVYLVTKKRIIKRFEDLKTRTQIVIVDKALQSSPCSLLTNAGWLNCQQKVDVINFDELVDADIIYVNAKGVGTQMFREEGLGLAEALKETYPNKKVIVYGLERSVKIAGALETIVDGYLWLDSEPFEFLKYAEKFSKEPHNGR